MTRETYVLLREGQALARRDAQLPLDQIEPGDRLGDRVLDLEAGVHFHEIEVAPVEKELDGAGAHVADLARHDQRGSAQPLAHFRGHRRRRRLLDELLVTALDRAVAVTEVQEVTVRVGEHLHLEMARRREIPLDEQRAVTEGALGQAARGGERAVELRALAHDLHALAAAPGRGLDDQRKPEALRLVLELRELLLLARIAGQHGDPGRTHACLGEDLRAHGADRRRRWPDEGQPGGEAGFGEPGVLGEEPVAGVDRRGGARACRFEECGDVEIALARGGGTQAPRLISLAYVPRVRIGIRVDRHGADVHAPCGAEDAAGDLAAVGDQQTFDHARVLATCGTRQSVSAPAARCAPPRARATARGGCRPGR